MDKGLIAPCGMNCGLCVSYLAKRNKIREKGIKMSTSCIGCRFCNKQCALKIRCSLLSEKKIEYCFECQDFPCQRLKNLDKRYKEKYHMSVIENQIKIKNEGVEEFLKEQKTVWTCKRCQGTICCHNGLCFNCDFDKLKDKEYRYKWNNQSN